MCNRERDSLKFWSVPDAIKYIEELRKYKLIKSSILKLSTIDEHL